MAKSRGKKGTKKKGLSLTQVISLVIFVIVVGFLTLRVMKNPISMSPYPYKITGKPEQKLLTDAENTQVLLVGDRMSVSLSKYLEAFIESTSRNITEPIKVFNMGQDGFGLHRTLAQLKLLKKLPPVVIYYGATQEFFETRAHPLQYKTFLRNKEVQQQEILSSMLMAWPELSKVLYEPYQFFEFDLSSKPQDKIVIGAGPGKLEQMEMLFQIYKWELEDLVKLVKTGNSRLILITPPINLDVPPKATCSYSEDPTIRASLATQQRLLKEGKSKEAYDNLKLMADESIANAQALYLFAQAAANNGKMSESKKALTKAAAVDCATWRGSPVLNEIIKDVAARNGVPLVDFDTQLNAMYGQNVLFFDEINPQNVFNRAMMSKLGELVARIMDL